MTKPQHVNQSNRIFASETCIEHNRTTNKYDSKTRHNTMAIKRCAIQRKAGSGKSNLIHEIVKTVKTVFGENSIAVCAPTGIFFTNFNLIII